METFPHPNLIYAWSSGHNPNTSASWSCICDWYFSNPDPTRGLVWYEQACNLGVGGYTFTKYDWCNTGYYAINPIEWSGSYTDCTACTNKPAHSQYTGHGGDWAFGSGAQNDCPWACDAGYGRTDAGTCELLCAAGITKLHAGSLTIPLYKSKLTSPAINIQYNGQICYASLAPGAASGALNINYGGNTYHSIR